MNYLKQRGAGVFLRENVWLDFLNFSGIFLCVASIKELNMLKVCFSVGVLFFSLVSLAEDFYYNKELIYEKKFNKLYDQFKEYFYTDGKKIYDLREGCSNRFIKDANALSRCRGNNNGLIKGEVSKILDKQSFLLKVGKSEICVSGNSDTSEMEEKAEFEGLISPAGKYEKKTAKGKKKSFRKYVQLTPVTKTQFKKYIKKKKLYTYKKIEKTVPAKTVLCPDCKGKGSVMQKVGKGKAGFRKCKVCKGKGNIPGKWKQQITWERQEVR